MSDSDNKPIAIEPLAFEAPSKRQAGDSDAFNSKGDLLGANKDAPWWHSQFNIMLCAFGLLAVCAFLVVLLIPKPNASSYNTVLNDKGESNVTDQTVVSDDESEAPWDETRRKQARSDSQDLLAELLASKKDLEAKQVLSWSKSEFETALEKADAGDQFYKVQDFSKALQSYTDARDSLIDISESIPEIAKQRVAEGNAAIDSGKSGLAKEKFKQALILDQNNIPALTGLDRADNLDVLLSLIESAQSDEQDFEESDLLSRLQDAQEKYQKAIALDSKSELALLGQQRLANKIVDKKYRVAMSKGFNALFEYRNKQAQQGFSEALKLKPNDVTATSAYRQSLASDKRSSLNSLIKSAKSLEQSEDWAQAMSTYQTVLQRDPNQIDAKLGVIRTRARAGLDESLRNLQQDPLALSKSNIRSEAEAVLKDALAIKRKGPILNQQISQIQSSLSAVETDLKVQFQSDEFTDVYLIKAGSRKVRLGNFSQKKMALKPGRYVLTGSRVGYVDVRKELNLQAGLTEIITISISCDTPINRLSSSSSNS